MRVYCFYDYVGFLVEAFVITGQLAIIVFGLTYFIRSIIKTQKDGTKIN